MAICVLLCCVSPSCIIRQSRVVHGRLSVMTTTLGFPSTEHHASSSNLWVVRCLSAILPMVSTPRSPHGTASQREPKLFLSSSLTQLTVDHRTTPRPLGHLQMVAR